MRLTQSAEVFNLLSSSPPFSALPAAEIEALAPSLPLKAFLPGEIVFPQGGRASAGWIVHAGAVRILLEIPGPRPMQIERLEKGCLFGLFCRLGGRRDAYPSTAAADGNLTAVRIPDAVFDRLWQRHPSFVRLSLSLCAQRLARMQQMIPFSRQGAQDRIAETLLRLHDASGPALAVTRRDLAVQAGAAIETVFRALAGLRRRGWIKTARGTIFLRKPGALAAHLKRKKMN